MLNIKLKKYTIQEKMNYQDNSYKDLEKDLLSFFSEIIFTEENPAKFEIESLYKIEDEIITDRETKIFKLDNLIFKENIVGLMLSEDKCLIDAILENSDSKEISLSLWNRLLGKELKIISKKVKKHLKDTDYIITSKEIADSLDVKNEIFINDSLEETVVIGEKRQIILHRKIFNLENNYKKIMHHIDYSAFKVFDIVKI